MGITCDYKDPRRILLRSFRQTWSICRLKIAGFLLFAVVACDQLPASPVITEPTISGRITAIDASQEHFKVLIEGESTIDAATVWFHITSETHLFDLRSGKAVQSKRSDLSPDLIVAAVTHGDIFESLPPQAWADTLVIIH